MKKSLAPGWSAALGWALLLSGGLLAAALLLLDLMPGLHAKGFLVIYLATFIPLLWIPSVVAALGAVLVFASWWRLIGVGLLVAAFIAWGVPVLPRNQGVVVDASPAIIGLKVVSANLQYGRADLAALQKRITDDVDMVALQEFTPEFAARWDASPLAAAFPHRVGTQRSDAGGTMLLSRTPVEIVGSAETAFDNFVAKGAVRGVEWHLGVIHSTPPQLGAIRWTADGGRVNDMVQQFADERLLLVGDFNAIDQHLTMRMITDGGRIRNAMDYTPFYGGFDLWQPTWPVGGGWPAFARIDHFLHSDAVEAWSPRYFDLPGTDHKAIIATASAPNP